MKTVNIIVIIIIFVNNLGTLFPKATKLVIAEYYYHYDYYCCLGCSWYFIPMSIKELVDRTNSR
jgi:hypothetical protein